MMTEAMLTEAADALNAAILASLPPTEECNHVFSQRFERKMRRIIRRGNHPVAYKLARQAAIFVLIGLLSFVTLMTVSPTVRAYVIAWVKTQYDNFTNYSYQGTEESTDKQVECELGYLPEGYILEREIIQTGNRMTTFKHIQTGQQLYIMYSVNKENIEYNLQTSDYHVSTVVIKDETGLFYESEEMLRANCVLWFEKDNNMFCYVSGYFDREELIQIANNLNFIK